MSRFSKSAAVLRAGGSLGVFGSGFVVHDDADPVWLEVYRGRSGVTAGFEPTCHLDHVRDRSEEFTEGGHFSDRDPTDATVGTIPYGADGYVALVGTVSAHRALEDDVREELFERMRRRIEAGGGSVSPTRTRRALRRCGA